MVSREIKAYKLPGHTSVRVFMYTQSKVNQGLTGFLGGTVNFMFIGTKHHVIVNVCRADQRVIFGDLFTPDPVRYVCRRRYNTHDLVGHRTLT